MHTEYFAAVNSVSGFRCYYDKVFSGLSRMYIIKGGPGTGKSTLMRKLALAAEARGLDAELLLCSSDTDSLDGVILPQAGIGIADGTAPHTLEAVLPGARDELIDLGAFWNTRKLSEKSDRISLHAERKQKAYGEVYLLLSAYGKLGEYIDSLLPYAVDTEKLHAYIGRLVRNIKAESISREIKENPVIRVTGALGMNGSRYLDSFEKFASSRYFFSDHNGIYKIFFEALAARLQKERIPFTVGLDAPDGATGALFLPDSGVCVARLRQENEKYPSDAEGGVIINSSRFIIPERLRTVRSRTGNARKLMRSVTEEVAKAFGEVRKNHFLLEGIYKEAMDFSALDSFSDEIIKKILSGR